MIRYDTLKVGSRVASNTRKHPNTQCSTMYYLVVHRFRLETVRALFSDDIGYALSLV